VPAEGLPRYGYVFGGDQQQDGSRAAVAGKPELAGTECGEQPPPRRQGRFRLVELV